jgi:DNA-binding MarR family transcriptional regulator
MATKKRKTYIDVDESTEPNTIIRTFILFYQTARWVQKFADSYLYREAGISLVQFIALQTLKVNDGVMTPSGIAEWTQTERHNVTTLVRRMTKDGLIETKPDSTDRRIINVFITKKGREALERAMPVAKQVINLVMSSVNEDDANQVEHMLKCMRLNAHSSLIDMGKRT